MADQTALSRTLDLTDDRVIELELSMDEVNDILDNSELEDSLTSALDESRGFAARMGVDAVLVITIKPSA